MRFAAAEIGGEITLFAVEDGKSVEDGEIIARFDRWGDATLAAELFEQRRRRIEDVAATSDKLRTNWHWS